MLKSGGGIAEEGAGSDLVDNVDKVSIQYAEICHSQAHVHTHFACVGIDQCAR